MRHRVLACPGLGARREEVARSLGERYEILDDAAPDRVAEVLGREPPDVLLVDLDDDAARAAALDAARRLPGVAVVGLSSSARSTEFVELFRSGFSGYVDAGADGPRLRLALERALGARELRALRSRLDESGSRADAAYSRLIGESRALETVRNQVRTVATTDLTVLVVGESGTGKEVVACLVHELGPRAREPFVAVHCGALPESLIDSELFGHVQGAFTGAVRDAPGAFVAAGRGTLFLDEIGTMPDSAQIRLLRALQTGRVVPVGGAGEVEAPARIVAATNEDLAALVAARRFRADLFYRLDVVTIELPPLRERMDDVSLIAAHVLRALRVDADEPHRLLSPAAVRRLLEHDWPGNVRELENVLRRAVVAAGPRLEIEAGDIAIDAARCRDQTSRWRRHLPAAGIDLDKALGEIESDLVEQALERSGGNATAAARLLDVPASTLRRWTTRR